ncbi:MAG: Rieske 2Fe-2S domain-containing protein [Gammaproteobacteria bacterium]|nr:Rieske 2Fe-2S domain-containing protein [Gammaproteobacteria bacterium]
MLPLRLAAVETIADGRCLGIEAGFGGLDTGIFLYRRGLQVHCYVNSCPHTGVPLEWLPHRFLDAGGEHIQCKTHGALFRPEDGHCVAGPCVGRALRACQIGIRDGDIYLVALPPPAFS